MATEHTCTGWIRHYASNESVVFYFDKEVEPSTSTEPSKLEYNNNLLFYLWKIFKDKKITITVEKAEE